LKPPEEFRRRPLPPRLCNVDRLFQTLEERQLDGLVAYLRPNVFYLSGFAPPSNQSVHETNGYAAVVISRHAPEQPVIVVAEFDLVYFRQQPSWITDIRPYATLLLPLDIPTGPASLERFVPPSEHSSPFFARAREAYAPNLMEGVKAALRDVGLARGRVGFDDLRFGQAFASAELEVADAYGTLKYVRQVKTPEELELLRTATRLNQRAIEQTIATWQRGISWQEMVHTYNVTATALGGFVRDPGAIVVANPPGSDSALYMTAGYDDFPVEPGLHIMWDCHGTWHHYCWDGGKTWVVDDSVSGDRKTIASATAAAMGTLQEALRPGVRLSELQAAARKTYRQAGLGDAADDVFIFFHGLGLEHIDMEIKHSHEDWSVEAGMLVSAHLQVPGDAQHRSWLEEIFLVTPSGGEPFFTWDHQPILGDDVGSV
jgi:Xaa-Pro aminopeptidase